MIAIIGARGVGKTTLVLQHIKLYEDIDTTLFVFADDLWFSTHSLVELAEIFYTNGGKINKIYLNNPNLSYVLSDEEPNTGNIRETIFFGWQRATHKITASAAADFKVGKYIFEVGGRKKGQHQIKDIDNAFVVKDDIEYGHLNEVPLWAFGLLY